MFFKCSSTHKNPDLALLLIRLSLAAVFIFHGFIKFQNLSMIQGFFNNLGIPSVFVYFVPAIEILAGILIALGIFVELAAIALVLVMLFAILLVKGKLGFIGGWEFEGTLLVVLFSLAFSGPGNLVFNICFNSCCKNKQPVSTDQTKSYQGK